MLVMKGNENMNDEKVYAMSFAKIYPLLAAKAKKKGRTLEEVNKIICWLTGYGTEEIENAINNSVAYGDFFRNAPSPNPDRKAIKGVVCGVRVETIDEPLMQEIRYLDKLIDELTRENLWIKSFADEQEVRGIKCGNVQNAAVHLRIQIRIIIAARLQKQLKNI